jgi:hypothetical protein
MPLIFSSGIALNAELEGEADAEGPTELVILGLGVAREVAVPKTPPSVEPPSAAACDAEDTLITRQSYSTH